MLILVVLVLAAGSMEFILVLDDSCGWYPALTDAYKLSLGEIYKKQNFIKSLIRFILFVEVQIFGLVAKSVRDVV